MPVQPLEPAVQTWQRLCTNPVDRKAEEELREVRAGPPRAHPPRSPPGEPAGLVLLVAWAAGCAGSS